MHNCDYPTNSVRHHQIHDKSMIDAASPVIDAASPVIDAASPVIDAASPVIDAASPVREGRRA
jgi:hypothetical protein